MLAGSFSWRTWIFAPLTTNNSAPPFCGDGAREPIRHRALMMKVEGHGAKPSPLPPLIFTTVSGSAVKKVVPVSTTALGVEKGPTSTYELPALAGSACLPSPSISSPPTWKERRSTDQ